MERLPEALRCPADAECGRTFEVSEVDPDSTLSEIVSHLLRAPHYRTHQQAMELLAEAETASTCVRCPKPSAGICCSSHKKPLCHLDYRRTHFVEVCVSGCRECAAENLPVNLADLRTFAADPAGVSR